MANGYLDITESGAFGDSIKPLPMPSGYTIGLLHGYSPERVPMIVWETGFVN